ncbi:MAG: aminotransferase class V-fold PLP-dependent enzyme [Planctomycetota bacterium]
MTTPTLTPLYLDHASTSFPKSGAVVAAVRRWYEELGVSADRGVSAAHDQVRAEVDDTRRRLAALAKLPGERCAFTSGATESLHLLFLALLRPRDRVVTTAIEHAAVARPLLSLRDRLQLDLEVVPCDANGCVEPAAVAAALECGATRLCVLNHASNVTGAVLDVDACLTAARELGTLSIVDVCQSIGHLALPQRADFLVGSAHKALWGPPGLGFVLARSDTALVPPKPGGSGSTSDLAKHPAEWPTVLEAGTPNTPAILGLRAALIERDAVPRRTFESALIALDHFADRLQRDLGARSHSPRTTPRLPILSFELDGFDPQEVAILAAGHGITLRSGFHCAPWIHAHLGSQARGTVRVSPGPEITAGDLDRLVDLLCP